MSWDTIIEDLQTDAVARLKSEPFFGDVVVLEQRKGIVQSDIETALGVFNQESGKKIGAVVIALLPEIEGSGGEGPGPDVTGALRFHVIEIPLINNDATSGTLKSASKISLNVLNTLHRYMAGVFRVTLMAGRRPITPLNTEEPGVVSYVVQLDAAFTINRRYKVATPSASVADGLMTLTCTTSGATIYYTTDGSYPGPQNATALTYSAPFAVTNGASIRAGAVLTSDYVPSDTAWWAVSTVVLVTEAEEVLTTEDGSPLGAEYVGIEP